MMKTGMDKQLKRFNSTPASDHSVQFHVTSGLTDNRNTTTLQRQLMQGIDNSPVMTLQRKRLENSFGESIQRVTEEDDELLQGKFELVQRQGPEEEELLQGRFEPIQRQGNIEEDELLQGKFESAQRQGPEEEELLQGKFKTAQLQSGLEDEELLQGKFVTMQQQSQEEEEEPLQGRFSTLASPAQRQEDTTQPENRTGMPDNLKAGIESLSGMDMSGVRVHYNSSKPAQLNALAYAQGTNIHLGSGQEKHLPHEAWHVVQQAQGRVQPTMQMADKKINDDAGLEKEADVMGNTALQRKYTSPGSTNSNYTLKPIYKSLSTIQNKSTKQKWDLPDKIKNHIFDGEDKGNVLSGVHSQARKTPGNQKLRYSNETAKHVNASKPYGAKVSVKIGGNWIPKNGKYKYSDMFPSGWDENKVTEVIEAAYDTTFTYKPNGETIGHRKHWKNGKWLGNAKGMTIVFAGHPPSTIYPRR